MLQRGIITRFTAAAAVAGVALSLAGCAGSGQAAEDQGLDPVRVGYFPLVHTATAVNAEENGLFGEEGVEVELVPTGGGAEAIPLLLSGDVDFTYTNYTSALLAVEKGLPLTFVSGNDVGDADHGIFVTKESGIATVADLRGKTFAINNLNNIGNVAILALLDAAGVDAADVKIVEMPYPDMAAALERGTVDAIWQVEPFQASTAARGLVKISDLFTGPVEGMPVAGWVTTKEFAATHLDEVKAFSAAIAASAEELQGDRDRLVQLVPTYTKVTAETVTAIEMPRFAGELDLRQLQKTADLMRQYGMVSTDINIEELLAAG